MYFSDIVKIVTVNLILPNFYGQILLFILHFQTQYIDTQLNIFVMHPQCFSVGTIFQAFLGSPGSRQLYDHIYAHFFNQKIQ